MDDADPVRVEVGNLSSIGRPGRLCAGGRQRDRFLPSGDHSTGSKQAPPPIRRKLPVLRSTNVIEARPLVDVCETRMLEPSDENTGRSSERPGLGPAACGARCRRRARQTAATSSRHTPSTRSAFRAGRWPAGRHPTLLPDRAVQHPARAPRCRLAASQSSSRTRSVQARRKRPVKVFRSGRQGTRSATHTRPP